MAEVHKLYGPPGTGKTTSLINIVADEISRGVSPSEIVYVSFTKVAAKVAIDRAMEKFPYYDSQDFKYFATIHSICFNLLGLNHGNVLADNELREFGEAYAYEFSPQEYIGDPLSQSIQDMAIATYADHLEAIHSFWRNSCLDMDSAITEFVKRGVDFGFTRDTFYAYAKRRKSYIEERGLYDFSDMLLEVVNNGLYPINMKVFIADESQDNSPLLWRVISWFASKAERVYLTGDPYQCLYSWSGAAPAHFIDFPSDETKTLKQSYRCPQMVHDLSRKIVEKFTTRYPDDDYYPRQGDVGSIRKVVDFDVTEEPTFWLFRTRYLLDQTFDWLLARGVPFVTRRGKRNIFDRRKNKKRNAASSLLRLPDEPITMSELSNLIDYIPSRTDRIPSNINYITSKDGKITLIDRGAKTRIRDEAKVNPDNLVTWRDLLDVGFTPNFIELTGTRALEWLNEDDFSNVDKRYIRRIVGGHGVAMLGKRPNLELATFHSVKGDEAPRVIIDPTYTKKPYDSIIQRNEEEHRLIYTAITRSSRDVVVLPPSSPTYYPLV